MSNAHASVKLLEGASGKISAETIAEHISPDDVHACETSLVALENTMNKGGGSIYTLEEVHPIKELCSRQGIKMHLDGARLFNALAVTGERPSDWGEMFDTLSVCMSKGLGCPVGSLLLGSKKDIKRARRIRKSLGGGMRQAGFLAAAAIYALDHHVQRLEEDHARAKAIGELLDVHPSVEKVLPVQTNIVIAKLTVTPEEMLGKLAEMGIQAVKFGKDQIRFVTHLDFTDHMLEELRSRLQNLS